jgi:hypothetical protein
VASAYRKLGGSWVRAAKICMQNCEIARSDILAIAGLACGTARASGLQVAGCR